MASVHPSCITPITRSTFFIPTPEPVIAPPAVQLEEVTKGIGAVVDIQQGSLGALEQQRLAFVDHVVEQKAGLADVGTQALGVRQILLLAIWLTV